MKHPAASSSSQWATGTTGHPGDDRTYDQFLQHAAKSPPRLPSAGLHSYGPDNLSRSSLSLVQPVPYLIIILWLLRHRVQHIGFLINLYHSISLSTSCDTVVIKILAHVWLPRGNHCPNTPCQLNSHVVRGYTIYPRRPAVASGHLPASFQSCPLTR